MSINDELSRQRNRDAADRTLMAWMRTCLSLISFGFGLDKIITAIDGARHSSTPRLGVNTISLAFVLTGFLAMTASVIQHNKELNRLRRPDYVYIESPRYAAATATLIALIGLLAAIILIANWLP
jgi:putative membrane protein